MKASQTVAAGLQALSLSVSLAFAGAAGAAAAADDGPWPTAGWTVATPASQGMDPAELARLVELGATHQLDSLLVVRHGRIVVEAYYAPFRPGLRHAVNSVTKAVVGTLAGIAVEEGRLRLGDPVFDDATDPRRAAVTVAHLLDMTSGIDWTEPLNDRGKPVSLIEMERARDWAAYVRGRPMAQAPGVGFNYNSGNSQLLSALLARRTGGDLRAFATKRLFEPLGIADLRWRQDPQGLPVGGFGLALQPRDMAKIGQLYLRGGRWEDRQLLPAAWVARNLAATVEMKDLGTPGFFYANGWWTLPARRIYMAMGHNGQGIVVLPEADAVAVFTSTRAAPVPLLIERILRSVKAGGAVADDAAAQAALEAAVARATAEKPSEVGPVPEAAQRLAGRTWRFASNPIGLRSLRLALDPANPHYEIVTAARGPGGADERFTAPIGLDGLFRTSPAGGPMPVVATRGRWSDARSFDVEARILGEPLRTRYLLRLRDDGTEGIDLVFSNSYGFQAELRAEAP